ncbi:MAG TPA: FlgD immunoglobulin-like domain containing protein, partial [Candidatus Syntrophosphaera sp.]|nr:FlgD immunoglobulin-like domain containing protein [Candidatus Syntrophosphaera sp.]
EEDVNPVELASFTATISAQNYITLTWVTQTETGMRGYYIYRDTDNNFAGAQNVSPLIPSANSSQTQTYVFEDTDVFETGTYFYWLQTNDMDGTVAFHGPVSVFYNALGDNPTPEIPLVTELHAVYPNPFNPLAFIPFSLAQDSNVSFKIYNARGQIVKHFELGSKAAGNYRITWDGTDYHGDTLSNGVYQIVMTAGSQVYQTKTTLLK